MNNRKSDTFARYKAYQQEVEKEVARTEQRYQSELTTVQEIFRHEGVLQIVRNNLVTRDSGLDKLLSFVGIKRSHGKTSSQLSSDDALEKPTTVWGRVKQWGEKAIHRVQNTFGDPQQRSMLWDFAKPIIITASLAVARNTLQKGVTGLLSLPLRLFRRSKRR